MALGDVFGQDDRIQLKVNDLVSYFRDEALTRARNEILINGIRMGMDHYDLLILIGEIDPTQKDNAVVEE